MPLDPRAPLVFDTRDLRRTEGSTLDLSRVVTVADDYGTDILAIPAGSSVALTVRLESVGEGVLVSGTASSTATGACVRCLDPVTIPVDTTFLELFAYADRAAHHRKVDVDADEAEVYELDGDFFDLEPVLRDAVVTSLPFKPLCDPSCPGLCSECGAHLADDPRHAHEMIDPRWAALTGLTGQRPAGETD